MSKTIAKMWNGRKVKREVGLEKGEITKDIPFVAFYKAEEYLRTYGYSAGSMDAKNPIGFIKGKYTLPEKWHNLTTSDKKELDGVMIAYPDFRNGDVKIIFFES